MKNKKGFSLVIFVIIDMNKNEVSILLEILDLEYLKPILIDRFQKIDELASVNLQEIGIQNVDDLNKLRYALDELQQNKNSIEQYDPILSINDSNHIITRIENETNLLASSLNLLLNNNNNNSNIPRDDATSDIDYSLYNSKIDQIEIDVEQLQNNVEKLIEQIQTQYPQLNQQQTLNEYKHYSNQFFKGTLFILAISVFSIGLMFYIKRK
jgi:outer membrane protein TolC